MVGIGELVARRTDLSTFLVHLTRDLEGAPARQNLEAIIRARAIEARSPMGSAVARLRARSREDLLPTQKVVSFTETPLEHTNLLVEDIANRDYRFRPYGIALPKKLGRSLGINPVWYLDITPGHDWLTVPLDSLVDAAIDAGNWAASDVAKLAPFIEQMGTGFGVGGSYTKEFWWEREWRVRGNLSLPQRFIGLCPAAEILELEAVAIQEGFSTRFIDPAWGLEEIIASLAGYDRDAITVLG